MDGMITSTQCEERASGWYDHIYTVCGGIIWMVLCHLHGVRWDPLDGIMSSTQCEGGGKCIV